MSRNPFWDEPEPVSPSEPINPFLYPERAAERAPHHEPEPVKTSTLRLPKKVKP